jgi:hypothetical protein
VRQQTTILNEALAAARGTLALLIGDRNATRFFDFSDRGVVTSFIGLLAMIGLELLVGLTVGPVKAGELTETAVQTGLVYAGIISGPWVLLRILGRLDAFKPYVVALNWANVVFTIALLAVLLLGLGPLFYIGLIAGFIVSINIGRIVMTLKPLQIVMMLVAQVIAVAIALVILGTIFPPSPEELAQAAAMFSNPPS